MRLRRGRKHPQRPDALEIQWEHVRLLERLPQPRGRGGVAAGQLAEASRAWRELAPLERWERVSESSFKTYVNRANHVRLWRLLDFVRDGDRVLDVGFGFGYVTGILLRERALAHYCGIDLKEPYLIAAQSMAEANRLDLSACHFEVKDALDITPEWMARHQPDLVLVLEVLEHVMQPERALAAIGRTIPRHATVLFTVPLLGRLEGVWGHVSLFDRRRIEAICTAAGLTLHHVEPLHSTWILVAASPSVEAPGRLAPIVSAAPAAPRQLQRAAGALPDLSYPSLSVTQVPMAADHDYRRPHDDAAAVKVTGRRTGVYCDVRSVGDAPTVGGVRLPVVEPAFARLQLSLTEPLDVEALRIAAVDGTGAARSTWAWEAARQPLTPGPHTHLLRPGHSTRALRAGGPGDVEGVVALDVELRVRPRRAAGFRLHRAAYLGPGDTVMPA